MDIKTIIAQKREWKQFRRSVKELPADYRFVYSEMEKYIFKTTELTWEESLVLFTDIIQLFSQTSADGKHVLDVTGRDVAGFCDNLTSSYQKSDETVQTEIDLAFKSAMQDIIKKK